MRLAGQAPHLRSRLSSNVRRQMLPPIDGLRPKAPPPLGRLTTERRLSVEFVRQGGKGHFAGVTLVATPSASFSFKSLPQAWRTEEERIEYEPSLVQGIIDSLLNSSEVQFLGLGFTLEQATADERSSKFSFFSVGRLAAFRLVSDPTAVSQE